MPYVRTTRPGAEDKYYIRKASGGYSTCIQGKPTDKYCDTLANCVGYGNGAINEYVGLGYEKYHFNCNAENFIERAIASGLSVVKRPVVGGLLVWQKGDTLSGKDGAGHVEQCYEVDNVENPTICKTTSSGYGSSKIWWKATRSNANGRWGIGAGYTYRGCIVPPNYVDPVKPEPVPEPTPEPVPEPTPAPTPEPAPAPEPKPVDVLEVGNKVKIIKTGKASSYGTGLTAGGIGWTRYITKIYKDRPYPYQVGLKGNTASNATTGFYKADALQKL